MNYLSVCSGIEAATSAWHPLGWTPVAFSEIEAFPSAVLAHHYPNIPNLGDMERFHEWPKSAIDVLVGGTPCQSFSVAGLRKGMDDPRGNLALVYLAIAERYCPRWIVWENVPGVLSSDEGRAMGSFLGGLAKLGYGYAWRVLDAQYFGLAQRRKRVFVVGYLGDWRPPAAVLLEPEGMRRDSAPCREAGENLASTLRNRAPGGGGQGTDAEQVVARCLNGNERGFADPDTDTFVPEVAATVTAGVPNGGAGHGARSGHAKDSTLIPTTAHALTGEGFDASEDGTGRGTPLVPEVSPAMKSRDYKGASSDGAGDGLPLIPFDPRQIHHPANHSSPKDGDPCHPLRAAGNAEPAVAFYARQSDVIQYGPMAGPLDTDGHSQALAQPIRGNVWNNSDPVMEARMHVYQGMSVRRLTPRECERLQGFPDDYTLIPYRGKPAEQCPDGPRYKALGNSMAVPVMRWIGRRISLMDEIKRELESS